MTLLYFFILAFSAFVSAAPQQFQFFPQQSQQIPQLDYYVDSSELGNYYSQPRNDQANTNSEKEGSSAKLETLDPDSEVELLPGAQPQQPPQQTPVAPNIPGLMPGQRVFIVHMPVPGVRPGTVGGYQPFYIVAAGPQGNTNNVYPGYQNPVLLNPPGQTLSPGPGVPAQGFPGQGFPGNPNLLLGTSPLQRPFGFPYQNPFYQPVQAQDPRIGMNQFISPQTPQIVAPQKPSESLTKSEKSSQDTKEDYEPEANIQDSNKRPKL